MKKWLLLALIACATLGCSKDDKEDNTVRYDEDYGYLTNLASVKHGVIGRWTTQGGDMELNTSACYGSSWDETLPRCYRYEITKKEGKYYITILSDTNSDDDVKREIIYLSKTKFTAKGTKHGIITTYDRKTTPPTP